MMLSTANKVFIIADCILFLMREPKQLHCMLPSDLWRSEKVQKGQLMGGGRRRDLPAMAGW